MLELNLFGRKIILKRKLISLNFKKLLFHLSFGAGRTRFCAALGFDNYPDHGWKNNQKELPGFEWVIK